MSRVLASQTQVNKDVSFYATVATATPVADYGDVQVSSIGFTSVGGISDTDGFWLKGRTVSDTAGNAQPALSIGQPQTNGDAIDGMLLAKGVVFMNDAASAPVRASVFASTFGAGTANIIMNAGAAPVRVTGGFTVAQGVRTSSINGGAYAPRTTNGGWVQSGRRQLFGITTTVTLPVSYSDSYYSVTLSYLNGTSTVEPYVTNKTPISFQIVAASAQFVSWMAVGN
jgi:hypothetical protein